LDSSRFADHTSATSPVTWGAVEETVEPDLARLGERHLRQITEAADRLEQVDTLRYRDRVVAGRPLRYQYSPVRSIS
jgi:hypothetical protein